MKTYAFIATAVATAALALIGCSRDHDLDDYKNEQFQKDYAKVAAVAGRYSGSLTSIQTGKVLSALQITLRANAKIAGSGNESSDSVKPILSAEIQFAGRADSATVTVTNGTYIDQSHLFHAELDIPSEGGTATAPVTIDITGTIGDDGSFNGTMVEDGFESEGGSFNLSRDGQAMKALVTSLDLGTGSIFSGTSESVSRQFVGSFQNSQVSIDNVKMTVSTPSRTRLQEVSDLLIPSQERFVTVNLFFKGGNAIFFPTAELDSQSKMLKGATTRAVGSGAGSTTVSMSLLCNQFQLNATTYNFTCTYTNDLTGTGTFTFQN